MKAMKTTPACLVLALTAGLVAASSRASEPASPPLKLAGTWKLNKSLSDDPARKMMEGMRAGGGTEGGGRPGGGGGAMGGPGGGGGGMGGPGGGGGMGGGGREGSGGMGGPGGRGPGGRSGGGFMGGEPPLDGTPGDRPQGERPQGGAPGAGGPPDQDGRGPRRPMGMAPSPEFTIDQEGDNLAMRTGNNLRLLHTDGGKRKKEGEAGRLEVVAKFVKGALVIESRPEAGGKRKETYTLQADGKLRIDFDFEGSDPMPGLKFKLVYDPAPTPQF